LTFLADGSIAYHAAALGIVYDPVNHAQRFFKEHIDDVTAIAFSPDRRLIATGEVGPKCSICIWDGITMLPKHTLKGKIFKGI
jgi:WD40 repeat protein